MFEPFKPANHIILASSSQRRSTILDKVGIPFEIIAPHVDETAPQGLSPEEMSVAIAQRKGHEVHEFTQTNRLILACDSNVFLDGKVYLKPKDEAEASATLRALSGRTHTVITGVCLIMGEVEHTFYESTKVTFWDLSDDDIAFYVRSGDYRGKTGAYAAQNLGMILIRGIEGDFYNVVGLPISRVVREMKKMPDPKSPFDV